MSLIISHWDGRLGNNILQLCHAIWTSLHLRYNITSIPTHAILNTVKIVNNFSKKYPTSNHIYRKSFYKWTDVRKIMLNDKIPRPTITELKQIMDDYIYDILPTTTVNVPDNVVVIHIRSGDTFRIGADKNFKVPPSSFYKKIILDNKDLHGWTKVLIVTEPNKINPTIKDLHTWINTTFDKTELYCEIQSSTLKKDIATILNAKSFIMSIGTFSLNLAILSKSIKNLYYSNGQFRHEQLSELSKFGVNCVQYDVTNCSIFDKGWFYTKKDMTELIEHSIDYIIKHDDIISQSHDDNVT